MFVLLCLLRVHGFSLGCWHRVIDGSAPEEVLLGEPRFIRSDDWSVALPLVLSQRIQKPHFPILNDLVGYGRVDNRVGSPVPIASWLTLFRPQLWGYFVQSDFGLAWHWWFRALALLAAWWGVFSLVSRGRIWMSLLCAVALLYSPFFQFWSMSCEPMAAMTGLCFVATAGVALSATGRAILLWGLLLAWAGGCFALASIYPPFQIPLAYLLAALVSGYLIRERKAVRSAGRIRIRAFVLLAAVLVAGGTIALYLWESRETLRIVEHTVYPGQRRVTGGDVTLSHLFNNFYTAFLGEDSFQSLQNICEAALFYFFFPLLALFVLWEGIFRKRGPDALMLAVGVYAVVFSTYALLGFPEVLARLTFLDRVQGLRALLGVGVANLLLIVCFLSSQERAQGKAHRAAAIILSSVFLVAMLLVGLRLRASISEISPWRAAIATLFVGGFAMLLLLRIRGAAAILAAVSVASTCWFNPVARGGTEHLHGNQLSKAIRDLDRESGGRSRWVIYNDTPLANHFRTIGVRAINGVHYYPQLDLWSRLDPEAKGSSAYNRYAHVVFSLNAKTESVSLELPQADVVVVRLHPEAQAFARLEVDYLLHVGDDGGILAQCGNLNLVAEIGNKRIYRVR